MKVRLKMRAHILWIFSKIAVSHSFMLSGTMCQSVQLRGQSDFDDFSHVNKLFPNISILKKASSLALK